METRRVVYEQVKAGSRLMLVLDASWSEAIGHALETAAATLAERFGHDPANWRWDAGHSIQWRHNLGRDGELAELLNIPPVPVGGDATTPFATSAGADRMVASGVSYRQVFDLSDLNAALVCIPPGNSGQPGSPHYADNVQRWRDVEYHPLYIDWRDIAANAEADLTLVP
jgi:penicillin amidase